nr:unnamed protein product [Callosobruchus chinensis]
MQSREGQLDSSVTWP